MTSSKLNFGCGNRFRNGWTNIDFQGVESHVTSVNLLRRLPFSDAAFDVVYSSHVLEHFSPGQADFVLSECYRVLMPSGILRIVVPDLEDTCREYLQTLAIDDDDDLKRQKYDWIVIELLDQLVRSKPGGQMEQRMKDILASDSNDLKSYLLSRTESSVGGGMAIMRVKRSLVSKLLRITPARLREKVAKAYLSFVKLLLPHSLRQLVFVETDPGERHQWMYDRYGLKMKLTSAGFQNVALMPYNQSNIKGFNQDFLDINPDGTSYKNVSLYAECIRP